MSEKLVSIITPCYNGEKQLHRMLDSVIAQTYRPIEFILVNDGSTDNTKNIAESYIPKFKNAGITYIIVNQENKGLAGAINAGLKRFTGDYLCWPDSDDYLEPTSVEERVKVLEDNPDYAVVSSDAYIRDCEHLETHQKKMSEGLKYLNDPHQFEHHLDGDSIFCCGCHMVRVTMFLDVHPDREIYPARRGQNWQLLLPLYYKYKWMFLDKPLYNYIVYPNSMSKDADDLESVLFRYNEHETILLQTLKKIEFVQHVNMEKYSFYIKNRYSKFRMEASIKYHDKEAFEKELSKKEKCVGLDYDDRIYQIRIKNVYYDCFFGVIQKVIRKIINCFNKERIY